MTLANDGYGFGIGDDPGNLTQSLNNSLASLFPTSTSTPPRSTTQPVSAPIQATTPTAPANSANPAQGLRPGQSATLAPGGGGPAGGNIENLPAGLDPSLQAFRQAWGQGLRGQSLVDAANAQTPGHAYYADKNVYAVPGGQGYIGVNGQGGLFYAPGDSGGAGGGGSNTGGGGSTYADPAFQQALDRANSLISQLTGNEANQKQYAQTTADLLQNRAAQLQQPLLSTADVARQTAMARNGLQAQRDAALKNAQDQVYARGFAPSSGLIDNNQRAITEAYTNAQANVDAQLQNQMIQTDEQRRNTATQLGQLAQQALSGGDLTAINEESRALEAAQTPVNLAQTGLGNAMSLMGQSPTTSLLGSFLALIGAGQTGQSNNLALNQSNAQGWGSFINTLLQALGTNG